MHSFNTSLILFLSCAQAVISNPLPSQNQDSNLDLDLDSIPDPDLSLQSSIDQYTGSIENESGRLANASPSELEQTEFDDGRSPKDTDTTSSPQPPSLNGRTTAIYLGGEWRICPVVDVCQLAEKKATNVQATQVCTIPSKAHNHDSQTICVNWRSPQSQKGSQNTCGDWREKMPSVEWTALSINAQYQNVKGYCSQDLSYGGCNICAEVVPDFGYCVKATTNNGNVYQDGKGHQGVDPTQSNNEQSSRCPLN